MVTRSIGDVFIPVEAATGLTYRKTKFNFALAERFRESPFEPKREEEGREPQKTHQEVLLDASEEELQFSEGCLAEPLVVVNKVAISGSFCIKLHGPALVDQSSA